MTGQETQPIETAIGIIDGRDSIYLDAIAYDYSQHTITFSGEINTRLCSASPYTTRWLPYSLTFQAIIGLRQTEEDFYAGPYDSSFFVVTVSPWFDEMRQQDHSGKLGSRHQHFVLATYDDVFDVIAESFALNLGIQRQLEALS